MDLLACAIQHQSIAEFNPFLSVASQTEVHNSILMWAQLCVLEDRLDRLTKLFAADEDTYKAVIIRVSPCSVLAAGTKASNTVGSDCRQTYETSEEFCAFDW